MDFCHFTNFYSCNIGKIIVVKANIYSFYSQKAIKSVKLVKSVHKTYFLLRNLRMYPISYFIL